MGTFKMHKNETSRVERFSGIGAVFSHPNKVRIKIDSRYESIRFIIKFFPCSLSMFSDVAF